MSAAALMVPIQRLHLDARIPRRAKEGDAGYDLYSCSTVVLEAGYRVRVDTGVAMAIPRGYVGIIADRSGRALEGLHVMGGVIDSGFRGTVQVILLNVNLTTAITLGPGARVAQLVVYKAEDVDFIEAADELPPSERDTSGFGSSGT